MQKTNRNLLDSTRIKPLQANVEPLRKFMEDSISLLNDYIELCVMVAASYDDMRVQPSKPVQPSKNVARFTRDQINALLFELKERTALTTNEIHNLAIQVQRIEKVIRTLFDELPACLKEMRTGAVNTCGLYSLRMDMLLHSLNSNCARTTERLELSDPTPSTTPIKRNIAMTNAKHVDAEDAYTCTTCAAPLSAKDRQDGTTCPKCQLNTSAPISERLARKAGDHVIFRNDDDDYRP